MNDQPKSTVFDPRICAFRFTALLNVPEPWRVALQHFGESATDAALELWGTAPEAPDGLEVTRRLVLAICADLRTAENQLRELDLSAEESEISAEELRTRRFCGRIAPQVEGIITALTASAEGKRV